MGTSKILNGAWIFHCLDQGNHWQGFSSRHQTHWFHPFALPTTFNSKNHNKWMFSQDLHSQVHYKLFFHNEDIIIFIGDSHQWNQQVQQFQGVWLKFTLQMKLANYQFPLQTKLANRFLPQTKLAKISNFHFKSSFANQNPLQIKLAKSPSMNLRRRRRRRRRRSTGSTWRRRLKAWEIWCSPCLVCCGRRRQKSPKRHWRSWNSDAHEHEWSTSRSHVPWNTTPKEIAEAKHPASRTEKLTCQPWFFFWN